MTENTEMKAGAEIRVNSGSIRPMRKGDTAGVLRILNDAIIDGHSTSRYVCPAEAEWEASLLPQCRFVYEEEGEVMGFIVLHPYSARPCYSGVAELSVYVDARARGKGVGKGLMRRLIEESDRCGFWCLTSNIYATNEASCRLHEEMGFRKVGTRERLMKTVYGEWMSVVIYELRKP